MVKLGILFFLVFYSLEYAQSDELKLRDKETPYTGKVIIIKQDVVQFRMDSTDFIFEFNKSDIEYIKSHSGKVITFENPDIEKLPTKNVDMSHYPSDSRYGITVFLSYQFSGTHKVSIPGASGSLDVNSAVALGMEYDAIILGNFMRIGPGFQYQFPRKQVKVDGSFHFFPFYVFTKFGSFKSGKPSFYIMPLFGYNLFYGDEDYSGSLDLKGDVCFGIGAGLLVNNRMDLRLFYNRNNGSSEIPELGNLTVAYSFFGMSMGIYF